MGSKRQGSEPVDPVAGQGCAGAGAGDAVDQETPAPLEAGDCLLGPGAVTAVGRHAEASVV